MGRHYFASRKRASLALGFYKPSALAGEGAHDQVYSEQCRAMGMRRRDWRTGCRKITGGYSHSGEASSFVKNRPLKRQGVLLFLAFFPFLGGQRSSSSALLIFSFCCSAAGYIKSQAMHALLLHALIWRFWCNECAQRQRRRVAARSVRIWIFRNSRLLRITR